MHTVDLLERALRAAQRLDYCVRQDWLDGSGGGACEIKGQKWLFLDLAASPAEQLHVVAEVLSRELAAGKAPLDPELRGLLSRRTAA